MHLIAWGLMSVAILDLLVILAIIWAAFVVNGDDGYLFESESEGRDDNQSQ